MTPNWPISSQEMFDTYRTQYNQLIENISQISRDQRDIFNQMQLNNERLANQIQLNNERLATHYNYNSQNINFLYINLDSIRLNMLDIYRPYTQPLTTSNPINPINTTNNIASNTNTTIPNNFSNPTLPSRSSSRSPSPAPAPAPAPAPTNNTTNPINPTNNTSSRNRTRYNIEFLYSYAPFPETSDLTDVPVYPTVEQINNATSTVLYSSITNPLNDRCPIGLEYFDLNEMVTQIRQCEHIFCTTEIQEWFQNNVHCPVCRYDIRDYSPRENGVNMNNNNRTRNRARNRVRTSENSIFNEVVAQFLNSYLDPSYNVDTSNNILR
jgi:hypothetical protein